MKADVKKLRFIFEGPPGPEGPRFVEVEDQDGNSVCAGRWVNDPEGYSVLEVWAKPFLPVQCTRCGEVIPTMDTGTDHEQLEDELYVTLSGGYGSFRDDLAQGGPDNHTLCKTCATALCDFLGVTWHKAVSNEH